MRYAITYMPDDYIDSVNTTIIQANSADTVEVNLEEILIATGMSDELARHIVSRKQYYIRNCDDVDYKIEE